MDVRKARVRRSVYRYPFWCLGIIAACLISPAFAAAATLSSAFNAVTYNAATGETNQLAVTRSGGNYLLTESGAVAIAAAVPCVNVSASVATCPAAGIRDIEVNLDNLNDSGSYDASVGPPVSQVRIDGGLGDDTLTAGGMTESFLLGREGNDIITGNDGDDDIRADVGNDIVNGGLGSDILIDGPGGDTVNGGEGADRFISGPVPDNSDVLNGGPGLGDSIDLRNRTGPLNVVFNGVADDGEPGEGDNLIGLERVSSGEGNDTLTGGPEANQFQSGSGDDVLSGGSGPDYLFGDEGNDTIDGGNGLDTINGSQGSDQLSGGDGDDDFSGEFFDDGADSYAGGTGSDTISGIGDFLGRAVTIDLDGVADDGPTVTLDEVPRDNAGTDIENLTVTSVGEGGEEFEVGADDILTGNGSANQLDGGPGNDRISGLGGPDALLGGPGDDRLDGGQGIDSLDGAGGSDNLRSRDSSPDEASCGSASDILLADQLDDFSVTCDQSSTGARIEGSRAKLNKKGKAGVKVSCPAAEGVDCKVKISALKGKKTLARGAGKVMSGKTSKVTIKLTKAGKKARARKLTLKAKTVLTDAAGAKVTTTLPKLVLSR